METILADLRNDCAIEMPSIVGIRCGAHTLHLIVMDAIRASNVKHVIELCRLVGRKMRTQRLINTLIREGIQSVIPRLDCMTRWSSSYIMVGIFMALVH